MTSLARAMRGEFSAQRDKSSRHELNGRTGWGRERVTFVRIHGGARLAAAPLAPGRGGRASEPPAVPARYFGTKRAHARVTQTRQICAASECALA